MAFRISSKDLVDIDRYTSRKKSGTESTLAEYYTPLINGVLDRYQINSYLRASHFIAQILHESGHLFYNEEISSGQQYEGRRDLGNVQPGDGKKFKGRGLIQLTGRSNYTKYRDDATDDVVDDPSLVSSKYQSDVAGWFWNQRNLNKNADEDDLLRITRRINGGTNGLSERTQLLESAKRVLKKYDDSNTPLPPEEPPILPPSNTAPPQDPNQPIEQPSKGDQSDSNSNSSKDKTITQLTQIIKPRVSPSKISVSMEDFDKEDKKAFEKGLGFAPFIWYNGIQINTQDVKKMSLYHRGILPMIDLTMLDSFGIFRQNGFPVDDTKITIFLSSRSRLLRSIHMDFKILYFKDNGDGTYTLSGSVDIPGIYISSFKSYSKKTSHQCLQDLSKDIGMGFCSNVNNTDDRMTWINPGARHSDFIEDVVLNSYSSDSAFYSCYIDFYYNLCYVDMGKEIDRDTSRDQMVQASGFEALDDSGKKHDEIITRLLLTTDSSAKDSVGYISDFEIINQSTKISIEKAYMSKSKYYDSVKKEVLIFNIDSITSDGSKSLILKGRPGDEDFFNQNVATIWIGKQDIDDGSGNVHRNYNYSIIQNRQNIDDLSKVACKIKLPTPNFTVYKYQKVAIQFSVRRNTPSHKEPVYKRLSGDWIIIDIEYNFDGSSISQTLTIIKRELSLLPEEQSQSRPRKSEKATTPNNNEFNENPAVPPSDGTNQGASNNDAQPPDELDRILNHNLKDNNKTKRSLVLVEGKILDEDVAKAYTKMKEAANADGIIISITQGFKPAFGPKFDGKTSKGNYITSDTQESLRSDKSRWIPSARSSYSSDAEFILNAPSSAFSNQLEVPGKSTHGDGISIDISTGSRLIGDKKLYSATYTWMVKNSWRYGFVRSIKGEEFHFSYLPNKSSAGPYSVVPKVGNTNGDPNNLFYADLGLNNINI